jgi:hypothetical protein
MDGGANDSGRPSSFFSVRAMDSPCERPIRPRLTVRHLMVANAFAAVVMAAIVYVSRAGDMQWPAALIALLAVPLVLNGLAAVVLGPGPGRNLVRIALYSVFSLAMAVFTSFPIGMFAVYAILRPSALSTSVGSSLSVVWAIILPAFSILFYLSLLVMSITLYIATFRFWSRLVPRHCPRCSRRGLVDGRVRWSIPARPIAECPRDHAWCLDCSARLVRDRSAGPLGPWRDASSPLDDRHFSLWTPGSALRRHDSRHHREARHHCR